MPSNTFLGAVLLALATIPARAQAQDIDFSRSGLSADSIAAIQLELAELSKIMPPADKPAKAIEFERPATLGGAVYSPFSPSTPSASPRMAAPAPAPEPANDSSAIGLTVAMVLGAGMALVWLLRRAQ